MLRSPFLAHKLFMNILLTAFGPISFSSLIRDPALKDILAYLVIFYFFIQLYILLIDTVQVLDQEIELSLFWFPALNLRICHCQDSRVTL